MLYPSKFGFDPLFPSSKDFEVIVKDDKVGKGVFCYRPFKKGEILAKITGEITQDLRQHTLQIDNDNHLLDTYFSGYFLHSCDPNISLNMDEMIVTVVKDIQANSYLFMDYSQTEDILYKEFQCGCGSVKCRGWITGRFQRTKPHSINYGIEDTVIGIEN